MTGNAILGPDGLDLGAIAAEGVTTPGADIDADGIMVIGGIEAWWSVSTDNKVLTDKL